MRLLYTQMCLTLEDVLVENHSSDKATFWQADILAFPKLWRYTHTYV